MKTKLSDFSPHDAGVFISGGEHVFSYSDGDSVEQRMLDIVRSTEDVDVFSRDLIGAITDWPSEYHFSPKRANIIRPLLNLGPDTRVLELGCGCGAITKAFAETGCQIDAVEGSFRRASVAAARVRQHSRARVHVANFQDVEFEPLYDVVTLIGVLEYSPVYIDADDPFTACLQMAASALKPGGTLLVAIENKLGLKYFSGITEDHFAVAYYGIEGRYDVREITTYGKRQLTERLLRAGFNHSDFYYPYPDYKLPEVMLSERAVLHPAFNAGDLVSGLENRDYSGVGEAHFRLDLTWEAIGDEGLLGEMANSFLVLASRDTPSQHIRPSVLAEKYTDDRSPSFNSITRFVDQAGSVSVHKTPLLKDTPGHASQLTQVLGEEDYASGRNLLACMRRALSCPRQAAFANLLGKWVQHVRQAAQNGLLPRHWADANPSNFILDSNDALHLIDREWVAQAALEADFVLACGLFSLAGDAVLAPLLDGEDLRAKLAALGKLGAPDISADMMERVSAYRNVVWEEVYENGQWRTGRYRQTADTASLPEAPVAQPEMEQLSAGKALIDAGRLVEANEMLVQALNAQPDNPAVLFQLGRLAFAADMPEDGLNILEEAVTRSTSVLPQIRELGEALLREGNAGKAQLLLNLIARFDTREKDAAVPAAAANQDSASLLASGAALIDAGSLVEANEVLIRALGAAPDDPTILFQLGRLAFAAGMPEDGLNILAEAAARSPAILSDILALGENLAHSGKSDEAELILSLVRKVVKTLQESGTPAEGLAHIRALSEEEWMNVLCRSHAEPNVHGFKLPGFPDDQFQIRTMGSSNDTAMREAFVFYRSVLPFIKRMRPLEERTLLDFGTGWGRFARTFVKAFEPHNIWGVDVDPAMIKACKDSFDFGTFIVVEPFPPTVLESNQFDLITAYSVFSHLSEEAANKWMQEFTRILRPGGIVAFTTQGRDFIGQCAFYRQQKEFSHPWHKKLAASFVDEAASYAAYDEGKFLFSATGGGDARPSTFYGEALIAPTYIAHQWGEMFDLLSFIDDRSIMPQAFVVLRRK